MAIEPIFEKINLNARRGAIGESVKADCKTMVANDSVSEVLSLSATAQVLSCDVQDGLIKCNGRAVFYICYLGVDGEIKKTECSQDFSSTVKDGGIRAGDKAVCSATVIKTDFDLTGGTLGVSATLLAEAEMLQAVELTALSGGNKIVVDTTELTLVKSYGFKEGVYPVEEEFELNCEIKEVLSHRASASISAVQCGVGSIIVDGQVYLSVIALQKNEKSSIIKEVRVQPFRMEIECEDAMPTTYATATVVTKGLKTDVLVDQERGKSTVTVTLKLCFTGEAWSNEDRTLVRDAFSTEESLELVKERVECFKPFARDCLSSTFNGRAGTSELPVGVTLFAVGNEKAQIISSELKGGRLSVSGVVTAIGYFCDGEGKPFTRKLETTFEKELDCSAQGELYCLSAMAERVSARLISAVEVELDGELIICVSTRESAVIECIKEVKCVGEKAPNAHAISVYIPFENEELWSLSKRLNVCPEALIETNPELAFPLTGKERIVVYRKL